MNGIEDEGTLRRAFASLAEAPPTNAPAAHPEPERIHDAVRGKLPPDELRDLVEHLGECPECAEAWRLAAAFEEAAGAAAPVAAPRAFPRLVTAAATVLVALLGVGLWWTAVRTPEAPVYRAAGDGEIVSLLPEGQALRRSEPVLRWQLAEPASDGTTYSVLVSTEDLALVAEASGLSEASYEMPAEALAELEPGAELLWQVEATTPEGRRVTSPTFVTPIE